ncbi:ribosomal protein S18-alanine N-acetyltransferase [Radicibacter daui]|uniref:ribosomal protein S18-alanine N-acetyltransferase n=1 Tax=Radicibacter daui TaxID=3064829 RepID=UPI004046BCF3
MSLSLRRAGRADAGTLARIYSGCFEHGWSETEFSDLLALSTSVGLVAASEGQEIGFILLSEVAGEAEIVTLGVMTAARRRGAGRLLLEAAMAQLREGNVTRLFLEVAADNPAAIALYDQAGFLQVGRRKSYYERSGGRVDALVLARDL